MSSATSAIASSAWACGGCFHVANQAADTTVVTGHRMAFAISDARTVLWDQIQYAGPPADFSWVLPVLPGAYVESSRASWFEALDAVTATRVSPPALQCAQATPSPGCGCGTDVTSDSAEVAPGGGGYENDGGVTVVHEGTVGPYATVTLQSDDGDTLTAWLDQNGYGVPPDIAPVISAYVQEGYDFIALRLSPGAGVNQMTPVRVVTPGPPGPLPLRMVKAGVGDYVDITLYVIGEGRFSLPDLNETTLATNELSWDFSTGKSNYADVREEALSNFFGYAYLTTFADLGAFDKGYSDANGFPLSYQAAGAITPPGGASPYYSDLADLYFAQSAANDGALPGCPKLDSSFADTRRASDSPQADEFDASEFTCMGYDDITSAFTGMHPASVWLNRLELELPRDALSADCTITLNASQDTVSNALRAMQFTNRPSTCAQPIFQTGLAGRSHREEFAWVGLLGLVAVSRLRRRAR
ncbi:MAG TPA: DUF2330 domain-containing protein [Polyangiaceae bacterium]|nr:DUF2330 domain-containing protein [Polyangiaceae bacterium]